MMALLGVGIVEGAQLRLGMDSLESGEDIEGVVKVEEYWDLCNEMGALSRQAMMQYRLSSKTGFTEYPDPPNRMGS